MRRLDGPLRLALAAWRRRALLLAASRWAAFAALSMGRRSMLRIALGRAREPLRLGLALAPAARAGRRRAVVRGDRDLACGLARRARVKSKKVSAVDEEVTRAMKRGSALVQASLEHLEMAERSWDGYLAESGVSQIPPGRDDGRRRDLPELVLSFVY